MDETSRSSTRSRRKRRDEYEDEMKCENLDEYTTREMSSVPRLARRGCVIRDRVQEKPHCLNPFIFPYSDERDLTRLRSYVEVLRRNRDVRELHEKQIDSYERLNREVKIFAHISKRATPETKRMMIFADNVAHIAKRQMMDRSTKLIVAFREIVDRYRNVRDDFFDYIVRRNVSSTSVYPNYVESLLIHTVNYAPTSTLAQLYYYVTKGSLSFEDICDCLNNICQSDDLYVHRTRFIVNRYLGLGEYRIRGLLNDSCVAETILYPVMARRRRNLGLVSIKDMTIDGKKALNPSTGECRTINKFYDLLYAIPDALRLSCDFMVDGLTADKSVEDRDLLINHNSSSSRGRSAAPLRGIETAISDDVKNSLKKCTNRGDAVIARFFEQNASCNEILSLANVLQWRYDGATSVDSDNVCVVETNEQKFIKYFANQLQSVVAEMCEESYVSPEQHQQPPMSSTTSDCGKRRRGGSDGGSKRFSRSNPVLLKNFRALIECAIDGMIRTLKMCKIIDRYNVSSDDENKQEYGDGECHHDEDDDDDVESGISAESRRGGAKRKRRTIRPSFLSSDESTALGSPASDKFVRYRDETSGGRFALNLYLDRFEMITPAMTRLLTINYDNYKLTQHLRFNEFHNPKIKTFAYVALDVLPEYIGDVCSRDAMNHYLYSELIVHRRQSSLLSSRRKRRRSNDDDLASPTKRSRVGGDGSFADLTNDSTTNEIDDDDSIRAPNVAFGTADCDSTDDFANEEDFARNVLAFQRGNEIRMRRFTCETYDLLLRLHKCVTPREAARILTSTFDARAFALSCLNVCSKFGEGILDRFDSVACFVDIMVDGRGDPTRLLYAPLACKAIRDHNTGRWRRTIVDSYGSSKHFLAVADDVSTATDNEDVGGRNVDSRLRRAGNVMNDADRMRRDLDTYVRAIKLLLPPRIDEDEDDDDDSTDAENESDADEERDVTRKQRNEFVVKLSRRSCVDASESDESDSSTTTPVASPEAIREFLSTSKLNSYVRKHASTFDVNQSNAKRVTRTNIAVAYMFTLARERARETRFGERDVSLFRSSYRDEDYEEDGGCGAVDKDADDNRSVDEYRRSANVFARLEIGDYEADRTVLTTMYPERYVLSHDTNGLAKGLACRVNAEISTDEALEKGLDHEICTALISLYIFANGDLTIVMFFLIYVTAIRFPGQFLKSAFLLLGTSDSGKSEFVSHVLRKIFSSDMGTINNSTLRQGNKDEINTDLLSMMNSHVCQCDEPEQLNPELFKNLISTTQFKYRRFFDQSARRLNNMAKLILTVNDTIGMRGDAGVVTRLKFCLRMTHKFKELHRTDEDTSVDFTNDRSTYSVAYQFATRCFARGVDQQSFRVGLFALIENVGADFCSYSKENTFLLADAYSSRLCALSDQNKRILESSSSIDAAKRIALRRKSDIDIFWLFSRKNVVKKWIDRFKIGRCENVVTTTDDSDPLDLDILAFAKGLEIYDSKVQLVDPIRIDNVPKAIQRDAKNLHVAIDSYLLLTQRYSIVDSSTTVISEQELMAKLRAFLDENDYNAGSRRSVNDTVVKLKERIKTEYPNAHDSVSNTFRISIKPKK